MVAKEKKNPSANAATDMQMLCNMFRILSLQLMKGLQAVLSFEEEYMGMTVNVAWSFEQTLNHISTVGSMWNLVEID